MIRPVPLFEIGYWGEHYLRGPGPQGRPEDRVGDFAGDARELRSLFPFEVTAEVEETAYGVSYSAVAEVVQILASDPATAMANLAQVASAAVGVVAFFRKRLIGGEHGRVLLYTIRSDQKITDVREVETDYSEWYQLGRAYHRSR